MAQKVNSIDRKRVQHSSKAICIKPHRRLAHGIRRAAVSGSIPCNHSKLWRERRKLATPRSRVRANAVEQNKRKSFAGGLVMDGRAVYCAVRQAIFSRSS